jgi:Arc/MetJ-type ribon-helix-helix transcriptional regulator
MRKGLFRSISEKIRTVLETLRDQNSHKAVCIAAREHVSKEIGSSRPANRRFVNIVPCHRAC